MSKYNFNTRWNKETLRCACLVRNPACDRFKTCEIVELTHNPFADIKGCMKERTYKREKGALRQVRNE